MINWVTNYAIGCNFHVNFEILSGSGVGIWRIYVKLNPEIVYDHQNFTFVPTGAINLARSQGPGLP